MLSQELTSLQDRRSLTFPCLVISSAVVVLHDQIISKLHLLAERAGHWFCGLADM